MACCGVVRQTTNLMEVGTNHINPIVLTALIILHVSGFVILPLEIIQMKKLLYPIISFVILCLSFISTGKKAEDELIEEQNSDNLILRPYQVWGLLWSCSEEDEDNSVTSDPTHYSELVDSTTNSGTHSSHYSGTHYSHSSQNHSSHYSGTHLSHYSSTHYSHSNHSSHYSGTHSSHYSGTHQSHSSHSSHSSHYSAR